MPYNKDQERDDNGRWTSGGSSSAVGESGVPDSFTWASGASATGTMPPYGRINNTFRMKPHLEAAAAKVEAARQNKRKDLRGENFAGRNMSGGNYTGSDLRDAKMSNSDFRQSNFRNADMRNANAVGANFGGSDFRGANLSNCDFRGANLSNCDFRGAKTRGAKFDRAQFTNALTDSGIGKQPTS